MNKILPTTLLIFFIMLTLSSQALAFRCGNDIISKGDTAASVQNKCGDPYQISSGIDNSNGEYIYNWFYNCGEGDFIYVLIIKNGIIVKIDTISRGNGVGQCQ
jgi:hypothetical protein